MIDKRRRKGVHPLLALVLLAIGAGVFAGNVMPLLHRGGVGAAIDGLLSSAAVDDVGEASPAESEPSLGDLLAHYGSFTPGGPVRCAFAAAAALELSVPAVPAGETRPQGDGGWDGGDPPQVQLTFIMLGPVPRAVINGVVVGTGDNIAGDRLVAIHRDAVLLRHGARTLTYGLESRWPREFAPELQRRAAQTKTTMSAEGTER